MKNKSLSQRLDQVLAGPMFVLSIVVLCLFATILHSYPLENDGGINRWTLLALALIYPIYWIETVAHAMIGSQRMRQHILICLIPILRIGLRDHNTGQQIWLPSLNWQTADRNLERFLTRLFSIPMIVIALLVLPVIILEFFWYQRIENDPSWRTAIQIVVAFIWSAFTFEFVVMISVVKWPTNYAKRHWIDLAIILLPLLAFMRALRLTQLLRLKNLAKTGRIYRLRGLGLRMWRGIVALDFIEKLLSRNPERRLDKLESMLEDKEHDLDLLKSEIARLKEKIASKAKQNEKSDDHDDRDDPSYRATA